MKKLFTRRMILRVLAILLLACMLLPQFAACKKKKDPNPDDGSQSGEDSTTPTEIPKDLMLSSTAGFWADGSTLRMSITNDASSLSIDFSDRFSVKKTGAVWTLTSDAAGTTEIPNKTVNFSEGENVFYVKVSFKNESFIYKAILNYHSAYTVEFCSNCNDYVETQTVEKGAKVATPATPSRAGYSFLGWYLNGSEFDFNKAPTGSITLIAHWQKTNTAMNSYYTSSILGYSASVPRFQNINAGIRVVWKDYANSNALRPEEVTCILTQSYGTTTNTYEIILKQKSVAWKDANSKPAGCTLSQGAGGNWTLSLEDLPEKVGSETCSYTLAQKPLEGNYTTLQSASTATNTLIGYDPSMDSSAKLTTRNSRLYDAAGNLIVFQGVVTGNVGWQSLLNTTTPEALQKLSNIGCNVIRVSFPFNGNRNQGMGYVYWSNGSARSGDYSDVPWTDKDGKLHPADERVDEAAKQKLFDTIDIMVQRATKAGLYIILDWPLLTSNPYQYVNEASECFGKLAKIYKDNPYVLFEICNEPANTNWGVNSDGTPGIKAYAERVIDSIRDNGSDAVIIVAPRGAGNYISMGPEVYNRTTDNVGDDPIYDGFDDDRRYNIAYTSHSYAYTNNYADSNGRNSFGWRLRDAYDAGLTVVITEMSPMDPSFDYRDYLGYDIAQMNLYMRLFQEYDINFCYFRYLNTSSYQEWIMLEPNINPAIRQWTRADLSRCGQWYYDVVTGDGVFLNNLDYNAPRTEALRNKYATTFATYGLENKLQQESIFTAFPTFAIAEGVQDGSTYYFKVGDSDSVSDSQYEAYCLRLWTRISEICNGTAKKPDGTAFKTSDVPYLRTKTMQLTYQYNGNTYTLKVSYGKNAADSSWGIFFSVQ